MRISDWSSDVCSSDLSEHSGDARTPEEHQGAKVSHISAKARRVSVSYHPEADRAVSDTKATASAISFSRAAMGTREQLYAPTACHSRARFRPSPARPPCRLTSDESRVGEECCSTLESRGWP